ncbi:hypothetical protein [Kingella oralis]|jgi:hypothetical protein|uniref:Uncharacterized protein n=1 Tax=Kingella oralis ATCC 51147 TaxID=629741 RepID=C4GJU3_9NEIS|nr:hypothetical protein [Kingella oralis]RKW33080.1 MAG: hypothetical protein D8B42_00960 [Kingella sp. (in: b-proteobacteria)]DAK35006.1 MAG TPA: hypothetical protein [Caudoviricetes sp.]EEP68065.1 hypothetical protein GCWU000324_02316 [Kingella oralis ATCC 51147]QMT43175.1 hypothetical protein H3L93_02165 [Kingella oralis]DAS41284.1 MAG TPA: hypothetical protein [Caudoviricetes sp.]
MSEVINRYTVQIHVHYDRQSKRYGCAVSNQAGESLCPEAQTAYASPADAIYQALHHLALENNFSGCLKAAECKYEPKNEF